MMEASSGAEFKERLTSGMMCQGSEKGRVRRVRHGPGW